LVFYFFPSKPLCFRFSTPYFSLPRDKVRIRVHMLPQPENRIVDTTRLSLLNKFRSSSEINVDVYFRFLMFNFAEVSCFHYPKQ
ncbi:MAG TPA: hypothetical protein P5321_03525, partial [Thermotogota bacterium]|nr:hypothetical protein [Thermotogota bacterium]HOS24516.1 hypothetical protein [Thermotogota bacterium]HOT87689.1 hypothetical protein [Thermotogota bacterium]HPG98402.1 hypothetical protein [Thermotogota bacterium]HPL38662.1 hypothetical protein [Thermotogota bacterium]